MLAANCCCPDLTTHTFISSRAGHSSNKFSLQTPQLRRNLQNELRLRQKKRQKVNGFWAGDGMKPNGPSRSFPRKISWTRSPARLQFSLSATTVTRHSP